MTAFKQFVKSLLSRKFLLAFVGAFVVFANSMWSLGLTEEQAWAVLTPILAYIGVEGVADYKSR